MLSGFRYEFTIRAHFIANSLPEEFVFLEFTAHDNQKSYTTAGLATDDRWVLCGRPFSCWQRLTAVKEHEDAQTVGSQTGGEDEDVYGVSQRQVEFH